MINKNCFYLKKKKEKKKGFNDVTMVVANDVILWEISKNTEILMFFLNFDDLTILAPIKNFNILTSSYISNLR